MSEPTKEELLDFMRKHGPEKVDSITDTESAIRHFRCTSKVYKEQRDTLIDDIAVLKANISRLERENGQLKKEEKVNRTKASLLTEIEQLKEKNEKLRKVNSNGWKHENKALRLQSNTYFDEWQTVKNLYTTLTNHIRLKAENNPGVSRYIDLVNYIDRLERD